jgi:hypothetical protein
MNLGLIPLSAYPGNAVAYVFAAQWLGGPAFSPEAQANFWISSASPNVAVVGLKASPTNTYIGNSVEITVTVQNKYYLPQSFDVTIYCNNTALQTLNIVKLAPYVEANFTYIWDTYTFSKGKYIIRAYAWPVAGETDTADNTYVDGTVILAKRVSPVHDVAVTHYEQSKDVVGLGYPLSINITVQNQGDYVENFKISVYANQTIIAQFANLMLNSGNSATISFTWNTTGFIKGKYIIRAYAWPVAGETDTADNNSTRPLIVGIPGDINGDGIVDVFDAVLLASAAGTKPGDGNWNPNADINGDNIVDIYDAVILAAHAGESLQQ